MFLTLCLASVPFFSLSEAVDEDVAIAAITQALEALFTGESE